MKQFRKRITFFGILCNDLYLLKKKNSWCKIRYRINWYLDSLKFDFSICLNECGQNTLSSCFLRHRYLSWNTWLMHNLANDLLFRTTIPLCLKHLVYLSRFVCAHPYMIFGLTSIISKYDSSSAKKRKKVFVFSFALYCLK